MEVVDQCGELLGGRVLGGVVFGVVGGELVVFFENPHEHLRLEEVGVGLSIFCYDLGDGTPPFFFQSTLAMIYLGYNMRAKPVPRSNNRHAMLPGVCHIGDWR